MIGSMSAWRKASQVGRALSPITCLGTLLFLAALAANAQTPPPGNGYLGSNVCKVCHPDIWEPFYKNPHYQSIAAGNLPPDKTGCEGCHGPAEDHVAAGGGRDTIPHAFSLMQPKQILETCLKCHAKDLQKSNIQRSAHTLNDVVCTNCHSIHHSPSAKFLLQKRRSETCFACHSGVRAQFNMPSKHRVNEGFMDCWDCHNPHGTFTATWRMAVRPPMVDQTAFNDEACIKCHADRRGPFVYEHAPTVIEGCEQCHYPHGSTNGRLLRRPVEFTLCLECHNGGGVGTRLAGVDIQTPQHNLLDPKYQRCTVCHVRIHGSNNDATFLR
jgi:DmsE family decaheme c-type cytochrome